MTCVVKRKVEMTGVEMKERKSWWRYRGLLEDEDEDEENVPAMFIISFFPWNFCIPKQREEGNALTLQTRAVPRCLVQ